MSQICDHCGIYVHGAFTQAVLIVHRDPMTGYAYQFCSKQCETLWTNLRMGQSTSPNCCLDQTNNFKEGIIAEELRQADQSKPDEQTQYDAS